MELYFVTFLFFNSLHMFQPLQGHLQGDRNVHLLYIRCLCLLLCYISHIVEFHITVIYNYVFKYIKQNIKSLNVVSQYFRSKNIK